MKDFFANLIGIIYAMLFALFPAIVLGIIGLILDYLGILHMAIFAYDTVRLIIILIGAVSIIGILFRGK